MKTISTVPQERFPPELVEQILQWQAKVTADQSVIHTQECKNWIAANSLEACQPKFSQHYQELYLLIRPTPKKSKK